MKKRQAKINRKTKETNIVGKLVVDGSGKTSIKTGIGFLDHMLELFAFHGFFDLELKVKGDLSVDIHHTNEDIGICLGKAFKEALGTCRGIKRYGFAEVPMDQSRAKLIIDLGNRYAVVKDMYKAATWPPSFMQPKENYSFDDGMDFLDAFAKNLNMNLHLEVSGGDLHHVLEAIFKALGIALDQATQIDSRRKEVPSTKGMI